MEELVLSVGFAGLLCATQQRLLQPLSLIKRQTKWTMSWAGRAEPPLVWSSAQQARWCPASWRWHSWWSGRWWTGCRGARWSCRRATGNTSSGGCPVAWWASATSDRERGDRGSYVVIKSEAATFALRSLLQQTVTAAQKPFHIQNLWQVE